VYECRILLEVKYQKKTEVFGESMPSCYFFYKKSCMNLPGIDNVPPQWETGC
jgi:hypothetical protein